MPQEDSINDYRDFWKYTALIRRAKREFDEGAIGLDDFAATCGSNIEELEIVGDISNNDLVKRWIADYLRNIGLQTAADALA